MHTSFAVPDDNAVKLVEISPLKHILICHYTAGILCYITMARLLLQHGHECVIMPETHGAPPRIRLPITTTGTPIASYKASSLQTAELRRSVPYSTQSNDSRIWFYHYDKGGKKPFEILSEQVLGMRSSFQIIYQPFLLSGLSLFKDFEVFGQIMSLINNPSLILTVQPFLCSTKLT